MWEKNVWNWRAITLGLGTWSDSEISSIMLTSPTGYTTGFVRFFWKSVLSCIEGVVPLFMAHKTGDKRTTFICQE